MKKKISEVAKISGLNEAWLASVLAKQGIEISMDGTYDAPDEPGDEEYSPAPLSSPPLPEPVAPMVTAAATESELDTSFFPRRRPPMRSNVYNYIEERLIKLGLKMVKKEGTIRTWEKDGKRVVSAFFAIAHPIPSSTNGLHMRDMDSWEMALVGVEKTNKVYLYEKREICWNPRSIVISGSHPRASGRVWLRDKYLLEKRSSLLMEKFGETLVEKQEKTLNNLTEKGRSPSDKPPPGINSLHPLSPHPSKAPETCGNAPTSKEQPGSKMAPIIDTEVVESIREYIAEYLNEYGLRVIDKGKAPGRHIWVLQTKSNRKIKARVVATKAREKAFWVNLNTKEDWEIVIVGRADDTAVYCRTRRELFPVEGSKSMKHMMLRVEDADEVAARIHDVLK